MTYSCINCGKFLSENSEDVIYLGDGGLEALYPDPEYTHKICDEKESLQESLYRISKRKECIVDDLLVNIHQFTHSYRGKRPMVRE